MCPLPVAYSYIRFSTSEQKKGDSLRRQGELSEQYAKENGLTLDTSLHLHDLGMSAFDRSNIERGALGGFLKAIEQGRIVPGSYLLIESLDRLSRDKVLDALKIFSSILNHGITIVTLADGMVYNEETVRDNVGKLIVSITIMARAHEESVMKSRRLKAAWENKRARISEKKLTARCPSWMALNEDRTEFSLIPEKVDVVMEIIALTKGGMGQSQIVKRLNERGQPNFSNHGTGWHSSYIQKIVTSAALYGEYQPHLWVGGKKVPHGDIVLNYYPSLISKEEFFLLQSIRSERTFGGARARKGTTIPNLVSGIVKCGYCGKSMILGGGAAKRVRTADNDEIKRPGKKVLLCDGGRRGLNCYAVQWDYKDFEKSFLTFCRSLELRKLLDQSDMIQVETERQLTLNEQLQSVIAEIDESERRLQRLTTAVEMGGDSLATIVNRMRELESGLTSAISRKEEFQKEVKASELSKQQRSMEAESIRDLISHMESLDGDELFKVRAALAEHIRHLIKAVTVYPAGPLDTPETIQHIRNELIKDGAFSLERIDAFISEAYQTEPQRTGRGMRGRYASRKDIRRFFTIKAKNGAFRVVYPDFDDPTQMKVDLGNA